jgi:hypothetical protein
MEVAGIEVVGPLPADLQSPDLVYMRVLPPSRSSRWQPRR